MKVIVFGGTGFFGKELVKSHLDAGNEVTIVTRGNNINDIEGKIEYLIADRTDLLSLEKILEERSCDIAYDQIGYCSLDMDILESTFDPKKHELKMGSSKDLDYGEGKKQAETVVEGNHSPYGIQKDWLSSRSKAEELGFISKINFKELAKKLSPLCLLFFILGIEQGSGASKLSWEIDKDILIKTPFIAHTQDKPFGSYLVMNININSVKRLFTNLDGYLGGVLNKKGINSCFGKIKI